MADFNKYSNYKDNTSFSEVVFGAKAPLLEVELNEVQNIITSKFSRLISAFGEGVFGLNDNSISLSGTTLTIINAVILEKSGMTAVVKSAVVDVPIGHKAYFKMEEVTATPTSVLKECGNTAGNEVTNTMMDNRSPIETSRRKVIQYTLMSGASVPSNSGAVKYVLAGRNENGEFKEENPMKLNDESVEKIANTTADKVADTLGIGDKNVKIYGIRIDKSDSNPATRCTYLKDAKEMTPARMNFTTGVFDYGDWGDVWFVKDNFPCMVKSNGSIDYKLNPNDYSKKEDGSDSAVSDTSYDGNAMSAIPCVWIKQFESGRYKYIYLSQYKVDDTYHAYAHQITSGETVDYIFMSMFKGALDSNNKLRSISGLQPMHSKTAENEIAYAKANGDRWFTKTWAQRNLMQCLLTMMFCNTNSQSCLGNGNLNYHTDATPAGTNGVLVTGTLNTKGQFWGANDNTHQMKAFHQEAVWGDQWDRIAGMVNDNGTIKVKMISPYPTTDLTVAASFSSYTPVGKQPHGTSGGFINETVMSEHGDIPCGATGSDSTFECDGLWFNNGQLNYALVGGHCSDSSQCGTFSLHLDSAASFTYWNVGASLSCR